MTFRNFFILIC